MYEETMSLCRICLENGATLPIFEDKPVSVTVLYKMCVCFGQEVKNKKGYPQKVCETCYNSLESAYKFINQFRESCKVLERNVEMVIKAEPVLEDPSDKISSFRDTYTEREEVDIKFVKKECVSIEVEETEFSDVDNSESKPKLEVKNPSVVYRGGNEDDDNLVSATAGGYREELESPLPKFGQSQAIKEEKKSVLVINETHSLQGCDFNEVKHVNPKQNKGIKKPRIRKTVKKDKKDSRRIDPKTPVTEKKLVKSDNIDTSLLDEEFMWEEEKSSPYTSEKEEKKKKKETRSHKRKDGKDTSLNPGKSKKSGKPSLCPHCGKLYYSQETLKNHLELLKKSAQIKCSLCPKTFKTKEYLKVHIGRVHNDSERTFVCDECGAAFHYRKCLTSHKKSVHNEQFKQMRNQMRKWGCKECGKTCKNTMALLIHTRSAHTGERPAVCKVCDARFFHESYLKQHMRLHTGDTPYKCPICSRGYAQRGNMLSHVKHNHRKSQVDDKVLETLKPCVLKVMNE